MLLPLCLLLPLAQDVGPAAAQDAATFEPLLSITTRGCEALFVDEKDQALFAALQLLDERLLDLPQEIPGFEAPPGTLELLVRLLGSPLSLTVGQPSEPIAGLPLPLAGELRLTQPDASAARALFEDVVALLGDLGLPLEAPAAGGPWVVPAPVPLWLGDAQADVCLRLGLAEGVAATSQQHLLPAAARLFCSGYADLGGCLDLMAEASGGDAELEQLTGMLALMGLESFEYEWACGTDEKRSHLVVNMPGFARAAVEKGLLSDAEFPTRIVATIPEDATWAVAFGMHLGGLAGLYREMGATLTGDPDFDLFALFEEWTGLDVEQDLIAPFGGFGALYASDTTGGGGLLSTVAVVQLADREGFLATWGELERAVADLGRERANGYLRFSHWQDAGHDYATLSFPGLPVPLELCLSTTAGYAVLGASPQATRAALEQIERAQRSLLDNLDFQRQLAPDMAGVVSVSWINTPRLLQDGYGTVGLLCSALANAVRSPGDPGREPGPLLPSFNDLGRGAMGIVTVGRRVGDDFRSETRADRSQLVNAVGLMGYAYASPVGAVLTAGLLATLVVPKVVSNLERAQGDFDFADQEDMPEPSAEEMQLEDDLTALYEALELYAIDNGGHYPESLEELVVLDANGESYLPRERLVDPWGDEYLYFPPDGERDYPLIELQD
jgi:hypothetical protein